MKYYRISRDIIKIGRTLSLKFNVNLSTENSEVIFEYKNKVGDTGLTVNSDYYMSLEYKPADKSVKWDKSMSVLINEVTLYRVVKGFEQMRESIYNGNIYAVDKKGVVQIYADTAEKHKVLISVNSAHKLLLVPAVIEDLNGVRYEGIIMYINNTENFVEIAIDHFEALWHILNKVDMFVYSQMLLNFYLTYRKTTDDGEIEAIIRGDSKTNIYLVNDKKSESVVSGTLRSKKEEDIFEGMEIDEESN